MALLPGHRRRPRRAGAGGDDRRRDRRLAADRRPRAHGERRRRPVPRPRPVAGGAAARGRPGDVRGEGRQASPTTSPKARAAADDARRSAAGHRSLGADGDQTYDGGVSPSHQRPRPARSPLTAKLQGFGTTIFAEMTALAVGHRSDQPRPGLPRHRRAGRGARRRRRRDPRRAQPVPAGARHAGAAPGDRRPPAALLRPRATTPTPRCSSPPAPPRRWPARCSACSTPATRSCCSSRCTTATRRASPWPARAPCPVLLRPATTAVRLRPRRAARRDHAADQAAAAQHAAQPDRQGVRRRRAGADRRARDRARPDRGHRRGLRAPRLRRRRRTSRWPRCPACASAR